MPEAADPTSLVERQAVRALAAVASTVVAVELLIWAAVWLWGEPYLPVREVLIAATFAWRGAWIGTLFLWSIGVFPWRRSGGVLGVVLLVTLTLLAVPASASSESDRLWALAYGGAVGVWLLAGRLFGVRIAERTQLHQPTLYRWSLRTIIALVSFCALVLGTWMAIWRSWAYERANSSGWFVGLLQFLLLAVMAATFCQSLLLAGAFRWRWASYVSAIVGPMVAMVVLASRWRGELAALFIFGGFCLLANGILGAVLHYYGWRAFFDTPVWDRNRPARFQAPSNL